MAASGPEADGHLRIDMRPDRVELSLQTRVLAAVTVRDTELALPADAEGNEVCVCTWTDRDERA